MTTWLRCLNLSVLGTIALIGCFSMPAAAQINCTGTQFTSSPDNINTYTYCPQSPGTAGTTAPEQFEVTVQEAILCESLRCQDGVTVFSGAESWDLLDFAPGELMGFLAPPDTQLPVGTYTHLKFVLNRNIRHASRVQIDGIRGLNGGTPVDCVSDANGTDLPSGNVTGTLVDRGAGTAQLTVDYTDDKEIAEAQGVYPEFAAIDADRMYVTLAFSSPFEIGPGGTNQGINVSIDVFNRYIDAGERGATGEYNMGLNRCELAPNPPSLIVNIE